MKIATLNLRTVFTVSLIVGLLFTGCKKHIAEPKPETPEPDLIPPSAMFVTIYDNAAGATLYMLNALNGALATKYTYPAQPDVKWLHPVAGNGSLYLLNNKAITAIDMKKGDVLWTYAVENAAVPILHDNAFYGVYKKGSAYGVYSLDATRLTTDFTWKYAVSSLPSDIKFYNGLLYVMFGSGKVVAFNPKTGTQKFSISGYFSSLNSLPNGVLINGDDIIDAVTGLRITTASMPKIPPTYGADNYSDADVEYATKQLYFVRTNHYKSGSFGNYKPFLTAVDNLSKTIKWRITYDGGVTPNFTIVNSFTKVWNDKLIMLQVSLQGSRYGPTASENYWIMDMKSGERILTFEDTGNGETIYSYIVGNYIYFNKKSYTKSGLPYAEPASNYLFAVDLNTGKQKWNNNELLKNYSGQTSNCVYTAGTGYSPYIQ